MANETKMIDIEELDQEELWNVIKDAISKYIEESKKEPEQELWPKIDDKYSYVDEDGSIAIGMNEYHAIDVFRIKTNNCHRTKEQALRHKEYITSPRVRARELVEMCDGFSPLGEYEIKTKSDGTIYVNDWVLRGAGLTFATSEDACIAINKLGEPLIKVALGVIVGEEAERIVREYVGRGE